MKPGSDGIIWSWEGQEIRVGYDRLGVGPTVVLLPALSSISTRREMQPLQERLASDFSTIAIDWPGFGNEPRPPIPWQPSAYAAFLRYVLTHVAAHPLATVAAGHAASYVLSVAATSPNSAGMLCLIAPTWRGPLPTMMGGRRRLGEWVARASDLPVLGQLLYRLNVNPAMVRMMARGHVYADPDWLTESGSPKRWLSLTVQVHGMARSASSPACSTRWPTIRHSSRRQGVSKSPYSSSTELRHQGGLKQKWKLLRRSRMFGPSSCRTANWPSTRSFPTRSPKR